MWFSLFLDQNGVTCKNVPCNANHTQNLEADAK